MKHIITAIIAFALMAGPAFAAPTLAPPTGGGDVFSSNGQGNDWWLRQAQEYPRCAGPANEGHTLTLQIQAAAYQRPENVNEVNSLAARREDMKKTLFACIREQYASNGCTPGAKGLSRAGPASCNKPPPKQPASHQPPRKDSVSIAVALDHCLQAPGMSRRMTYYRSPKLRQYSGPLKTANGAISFNPSGLNGFTLTNRAYLLADSFAQYALQLRDANTMARSNADERDEIVGFLTRCLVHDGILPMPENRTPNDPRLTYEDFTRTYEGARNAAQRARRLKAFSEGFNNWPLVPTPLVP